MIPLIQLPYRNSRVLGQQNELPRWLVAVVLGIILCVQIGLLLLLT